MASHIQLRAETDGSVSNGDVRDGLSGMDVSVSSPFGPDGRAVSTAWDDDDVVLRASGDDVTKKSESALVSAVESVAGVEEVTVEDGGYETPTDDEE
jgi:hypothetical protein